MEDLFNVKVSITPPELCHVDETTKENVYDLNNQEQKLGDVSESKFVSDNIDKRSSETSDKILYKFLETPRTLKGYMDTLDRNSTNMAEFLNRLTFSLNDYYRLGKCNNMPFSLAVILQEKCQTSIPIKCTRPRPNIPPTFFIRHDNSWHCENGGMIHYMLFFGEYSDDSSLVIQFMKGFLMKCYDMAQKESKATKNAICNIQFLGCDVLRYITERKLFQIDTDNQNT
jgi:hypothetical protein